MTNTNPKQDPLSNASRLSRSQNGDEPVSTLTQDFHTRLDNLLRTLVHAKPHFVRCLRSNASEKPAMFDRATVIKQIRALQVQSPGLQGPPSMRCVFAFITISSFYIFLFDVSLLIRDFLVSSLRTLILLTQFLLRLLLLLRLRSLSLLPQVLETVNLMAGGYPHRMRFKTFNMRYRLLAPFKKLRRVEDKTVDDCKLVLEYFVRSLEDVSKSSTVAIQWALGKRHIFLRWAPAHGRFCGFWCCYFCSLLLFISLYRCSFITVFASQRGRPAAAGDAAYRDSAPRRYVDPGRVARMALPAPLAHAQAQPGAARALAHRPPETAAHRRHAAA